MLLLSLIDAIQNWIKRGYYEESVDKIDCYQWSSQRLRDNQTMNCFWFGEILGAICTKYHDMSGHSHSSTKVQNTKYLSILSRFPYLWWLGWRAVAPYELELKSATYYLLTIQQTRSIECPVRFLDWWNSLFSPR